MCAEFAVIQSDRLPIVSISYCWMTAAHPDPHGKQLQHISTRLQSELGKHNIFKILGIFWDFGSLHQKDASDKRTPAEWKIFNKALSQMGRSVGCFTMGNCFQGACRVVRDSSSCYSCIVDSKTAWGWPLGRIRGTEKQVPLLMKDLCFC